MMSNWALGCVLVFRTLNKEVILNIYLSWLIKSIQMQKSYIDNSEPLSLSSRKSEEFVFIYRRIHEWHVCRLGR